MSDIDSNAPLDPNVNVSQVSGITETSANTGIQLQQLEPSTIVQEFL